MTDVPDHDHALLSRFVAGNRAALGELAALYEQALLGLAKGLLGGDADAACDAVQSMWVRVIRYGKGFQGNSSVKTWLYRILINECRTTRRFVPTTGPEPASLRLADSVAPAEAGQDLRRALGALPEERRELLLLCYHAGLTHEVVAGILGIPLGTVKSRLHAALTELRKALGEEGAA